jgi:hypothetical protein
MWWWCGGSGGGGVVFITDNTTVLGQSKFALGCGTVRYKIVSLP